MRRLFLIALFIFYCNGSFGQTVFSPFDTHIFYGCLHLGANISQVVGDGFSGYHKVGIAGGGMVYVKPFRQAPWSWLAGSVGIGFAQKGSAEAGIRDTYTGPAVFRYRIHLQYAELPVLLHLIMGGRIQYSAGLSYNRLLSSKEESEDVNVIKISPEFYPFPKDDLCGIAGFTYRLGGALFFGGQYQYTLGSIRSEPYIPPGYGFGMERNNVISLQLLYIIPSRFTY